MTNIIKSFRQDNQGCIKLGGKKEHFKRTMYIDIRHHFIQKQIDIGIIKLEYINTSEKYDMLYKLIRSPNHLQQVN